MLNLRLVRRQIAASLNQAVLFVLCVVLSLVTLVSLSGFSRSVHSSFLRDARVLHAADIVIRSHEPISQPVIQEIASLEARKALEHARVYEFYSVARSAERQGSLLSNIKVVEPGYPFYGSVELESGRAFRDALSPGSVIAERTLLDRLRMTVGDHLRIGSAEFIIRDVVLREPDRPVNFFSLGPRIFIHARDLESLDLLGKGSRVSYTILARVRDQNDLDVIAARLRDVSQREQIDTFRTADSGVKRFFDNFLFFLNLIGIFTLLLAGIGIQSSLTAFLKEQERTIAIMKAVGAGSRFILRNYFSVVAVLGLFGTALGLSASLLLEKALPGLFRGLLPPGVELTISATAIAEGLALGGAVVLLFTFIPLFRLKEVRPRSIFGKEEIAVQTRSTWLFSVAVVIFFLGMVLWRIGEARIGIYFVLGVGALILLSLLCSVAVLRVLRKLRPRNLFLRQALKGLFRPRSATLPIIVTLTASLAVIFSIMLVERNLDATFVRSYPPDSPNLFFIDIQPGQKDAFARELGIEAVYHPVVRGVILAVNNEPIDREQEQQKRGDNLAREFSLTYREALLEDERIVMGSGLFRPDWAGPQVSVMDTVLDMRSMKIGDVITFRIQGIPIDARISSIRTRTRASLQPFFYFVFQDRVLADAPQALFTALRVDKERIAELQNRIVARFPNVSVIDVTDTVTVFAKIMSRLSTIVNFFTLVSVIAGMLIIVSSVFATRYTRVREAVFFTILGARGRFVLAVFGAEGMIIGLAGGLIALALAQTGSWIICRFALDVPYKPFIAAGMLMVLLTMILVAVVGLVASVPILRQKPAAFLREQTEE